MKPTLSLLLNLAVIIILLMSNCCPPEKKIDHSEKDTESQWHVEDSSNIVRNQLIVRFYDEILPEKKDSLLETIRDRDLKITDSCGCGSLYLLEHNSGRPLKPEDALVSPSGRPGHEENGFYNLTVHMDTPFRGEKKQAVNYDTITNNGQFVKVAIIDGGISNDNNLGKMLWINKSEVKNRDDNCYIGDINGYDFTTNTGHSSTSINMHGAYVSWILLKSLDPGYNVRLMDLKIFDENGNGRLFDALCAIDYAIKKEADFINTSWGYYRNEIDTSGMRSDTLLLEYIEKAGRSNIPVFASAGNFPGNTDKHEYHYPSGFFSNDPFYPENIISVAAIDANGGNFANYSNYGENSVLIAAQGDHEVEYNSTMKIINGTSYATPCVLGYSLMLRSSLTDESPKGLKNCLMTNAIDQGFQIKTHGKINIYKKNCP